MQAFFYKKVRRPQKTKLQKGKYFWDFFKVVKKGLTSTDFLRKNSIKITQNYQKKVCFCFAKGL